MIAINTSYNIDFILQQQELFLSLHGVTKRYDRHLAVDQVDLHIPKGKIYGLLGPNGAGKTSIIRMITGITIPDEGHMLVEGKPWSRKEILRMGYMPEERGLYKKMKVFEQLTYLLQLKGLEAKEAKSRSLAWLTKLGLEEWKHHKAAELSKGMQQKVQFIATIAHEPKLLILDEPFSGLDPVNTQVMEKEILELKEKGTTIIFSTHRMEQVEELCDSIALVNKGKVILEEEIKTVRKKFQKNIYHLEYEGEDQVLEQLKDVTVEIEEPGVAMLAFGNNHAQKALLHQLVDLPLEILSFSIHIPRLNEIFIDLVSDRATTA